MLCASASVADFIPNDAKLGGDVGKIALLTGKFPDALVETHG